MSPANQGLDPHSEGALLIIQSARDRLAKDLEDMEEGVRPRLPAGEIAALRDKLKMLDEILADHGVVRQ